MNTIYSDDLVVEILKGNSLLDIFLESEDDVELRLKDRILVLSYNDGRYELVEDSELLGWNDNPKDFMLFVKRELEQV